MTGTAAQRRPARSGWPALAVTVVARSVLAVLVSLVGWSTVPALFGWHPTVVMTGSMQPKLVPGDVVVSRPIAASQLAVGQVLLVDSPDQPGELRLHRLVRFGPGGTLILRGDANRTADSTPVERSAVHGVGALHIPYLGRPYLWMSDGQTGPLILAALALIVVLALACLWRPGPADGGVDDAGPPAAAGPEPAPLEPALPRAPEVPGRTGSLRRVLLLGATAVLIVAVSMGTAEAATAYTGTTSAPASTWAANSWFSCANAVRGDGAASALPLSESSGSVAVDISGNGVNGSYSSSGISYGAAGPCVHDGRTAVTLDGSTGSVTGGGSPGNGALSFEIWFKATGSHGGVLMSLLSNGSQSKAVLAMTSSGTLTFANGSASAAVTSTTSYNDGRWHLAVATVDTSGMRLYVDAQAAVTSTASAGVAGTGTSVQIGYGGKANKLLTPTADYFQGSVAFASWYPTALTAAQVAAHYAAAH